MPNPLSVTVLTGSPGADGAKVFDRIRRGPEGLRVTSIVPGRGRKRSRSNKDGSVIPTTERLVRLGQGCSCCTVRGDLMTKVQRIAEENSADHIVIQAAPHSDLTTLAKTFTVADDSGAVLSRLARIESLVTVIDAASALDTLGSAPGRALIERIELANVIVVDGAEDLSADAFERIANAVEALNPYARLARSDEDGFALSSLRSDQPFDLAVAEERSKQLGARLDESSSSESIVRFAFQDRRPFHPGRLQTLLDEEWPGVLRSQGTFWVASRPDLAASMDVAAGSHNTAASGMWWATVPEGQRPEGAEFQQYIESIWHPEFGDRLQDLTFVGVDVDEAAMRKRLAECLLTAEELASPEQWPSMPHPFAWAQG